MNDTICPCGSSLTFSSCCKIRHNNSDAQTPETLMRSRYSAFATANIDYIEKTMLGDALNHFNKEEAQKWAQSVLWLGLTIINTDYEPNNPQIGYVEFVARYLENSVMKSIHERSEFHHINGQWFYMTGIKPEGGPIPKTEKIPRNALCPCQSGKKFKNCHAKN